VPALASLTRRAALHPLKLHGRPRSVLGALSWLLLAGVIGVLAACSAPDKPELRVGISAFPPYELMFLARELGYFRDAGVDVRLVEFADLSDAQRAFEQGKLDGLATTLVEVLVTRNATARNLRVVRAISTSDGADVLLADNSLQSVPELRGKKVAIETGSLGQFVLTRALETAGLTLAEVTPVPMPQAAMPGALLRGEVKAVVTYPPQSGAMRKGTRMLFSSRQIPGEVVDVYAFDAQVIASRGTDLKRFFGALDRAFVQLNAHRLQSCGIMGKRENLDAQAFCDALGDGITLVSPDAQAHYLGPAMALRQTVATVQRTLAGNGLIRSSPDVADCLEPLLP
jgi:NitT/TauT family transport system substrate-binding protein